MEEKKNNNSPFIIAIVILCIIIAGLVAYILLNNNSKDNKNETPTQENAECEDCNDPEETTVEKKDAAFFDEYLYYILPAPTANNFMRNMDKFTDEDINTFLHFYYVNQVNNGILAEDTEGSWTYTTTKDEFDKVVYKYFGIKDYTIENSEGRAGIRKLSNNEYQVFWFPTGWMAPSAKNIGVTYNGNNVTVEYELFNESYEIDFDEDGNEIKKNETREVVGNLKIYLTYNEGNYNITKIAYQEK